MKTKQNTQCPNCWGYQEYNEIYPDRILCECKTTTNNK